MSNEQIYLYRRKGLSDYATCDRARYVELSQHKLFETMICYGRSDSGEIDRLEKSLTQALSRHADTGVELALLNDKLAKASAYVQKMVDCAGTQPSVATGYLRDILDVLQDSAEPAKPEQVVWIGMEDLPEHEVGARYRIILDDIPQACTELKKEDGKRWFRGDDSGTFPIDEIQAWLPIAEPANQESAQ